MKALLVRGSYIGSRLPQRLHGDSHEVHVVHTHFTGPTRNLDHLKGYEKRHVHFAGISGHGWIGPLFVGKP